MIRGVVSRSDSIVGTVDRSCQVLKCVGRVGLAEIDGMAGAVRSYDIKSPTQQIGVSASRKLAYLARFVCAGTDAVYA